MGRTTQKAEKALLDILKESPKLSKKAIKKTVKAKKDLAFQKKHVKKALQKLCEEGMIVKMGKEYSIAQPSSGVVGQATTGTTTTTTSMVTTTTTTTTSLLKVRSSSSEQQEHPDETVVPIAEKLRQTNGKKKDNPRKKVTFGEPELDVDEEIRRLEMELQQQSDDDDDSGDDDSSSYEMEGQGSLCLSKYADDRVENLPASCLPIPGRYDPNDHLKKKTKKKNPKSQAEKASGHERGSGLKHAVKELLQGYQARSSEKLPFYCRFCSKQYQNEDEFFDHKQTEFHKTAVAVERKATFCRLCRKQLTSPEQMKEHLSSKPHKEKLQTTRNYQRNNPQHNSNKNNKKGNNGTTRGGRQWV